MSDIETRKCTCSRLHAEWTNKGVLLTTSFPVSQDVSWTFQESVFVPSCQDEVDRWKSVRTALSPSFTGARLKSSLPSILRVCRNLVTHLERQSGAVEVGELANKFTTDCVFTAGFGIEADVLLDPESVIWKMVAASFSTELDNGFLASLLMPVIAYVFKIRMYSREFAAFFTDILKQSAEHRKVSGVKRSDYLQSLIDLKNVTVKSGDNDTLSVNSYEDVAAHAHVMFLDGVGTAASPIMYTLYELALSTEIQERLREAINLSVDSLDDLVDVDKIHSLKYLDMVVNEALRKYPPLYGMTRRCTQQISLTLNNGRSCQVPHGSFVVIPTYLIQHDPEHYPDPDRFDPERFSEEDRASRHKFTFLPFGEGQRICIGMKFAMLEIKAALIAIVKNFTIQHTERTKIPIEFDESSMLFATTKDHEVWLQLRKI